MSDETAPNNGRVTLRDLYELLTSIDQRFEKLDEKYVQKNTCNERHRYIDPRQIWAAAALLAIVGPVLTAVIIGSL